MRNTERGTTLVETLVAMAVLSTLIFMTAHLLGTAQRGTQDNINKQFATQKAVSILEELRSLIQVQNGESVVVLDSYDDGVTNRPVLTTQADITDPAAPASGNIRLGTSKWQYERRITVQRLPGSNDLRLVNVKIFVNDGGGTRLLAEVASVLTTVEQVAPPTQVYDVYLVAAENVPGWWLYMQNVVPFVDGAIQDLEGRHPGLQFRRHWIRKLSYGRDPRYTPFVNSAADSTAAINSVYFYPGKLPTGLAVENYYPPDFFNGRINVDGDVRNGYDAVQNPVPYALADQYNNAMRYYEEKALFDRRVAAGLESADTPTLRLLLDDMYMHPLRYRNAIVINLHGELFPFPPVRNYSDAAKDPATFPWIRAVTHPERLRYSTGDPIALRVYSYHTRSALPSAVPDWLGRGVGPTPITVVLKGINWTPAGGSITAITGGVDFNGDGNADNYSAASASTSSSSASAPTRMWWSSSIDGSDTVIRLYNSPLKSPCVAATNPCDRGGISSAKRLYSLEYIPSPVEDFTVTFPPAAFSTNLATANDIAKNTARWVINVPASVLPADSVLTIETRVGDTTTDTHPNVSTTYAWRGSDQWVFGDATHDPNLPITERFQYLGDPRHCPYADLKMPHRGSGRSVTDPLGMSYNRYFDDFHGGNRNAATTWRGYSYEAPPLSGNWNGIKNNANDSTQNNDGWDTRSGMVEVDVPRVFQTLRSALTRSNAIYTTMTGFSYYYLGMGGEIGYDSANGFANSIPVSAKPFTGGGGSRNEQSITDAETGGVKYVRENSAGADYWWSMSWLGELYPDSAWSQWSAGGNLATGTGTGTFSRVLRDAITARLPEGTVFNGAVRRTQEEGSTTFFWSGRPNSTFHHVYADNTSSALATDGTTISQNYRLPLADSIASSRPFNVNIDDQGSNPDHFLQSAYGAPTTVAPMAEFYRHSNGGYGSALLTMRDGGDVAYVVVNGLSPVGESGIAFISRWSFLSLTQSFLNGGLLTNGGNPDVARVRELPRVVLTAPNQTTTLNDPASIRVTWQIEWKRWDGLKYAPAYPAAFTDDATVRYTVLYSRDNGRNWLHVEDDSVATTGTRPGAAYLRTVLQYDWSVPAGRFPQGNYVIRVEAYRDEAPLHYAFHQFRAFVKR